MMMQSMTILDCLEQELEMSGMLSMPGMPGMPDSASLEKQFKELIRKVKSKGGTNVVLTNPWSDEFDPNEYENSTYPDSDGDGVDDYDESLLGSDGKPIGDKDDPSITPTSAQINAGTPP